MVLARESCCTLHASQPSTLTCSYVFARSGNTGTVERLGIKSICFTDGPVGYVSVVLQSIDARSAADLATAFLSSRRPRPVVGVTQFPAGVTVAATWDHDLIYARALGMGQEFKGKGGSPVSLEADCNVA